MKRKDEDKREYHWFDIIDWLKEKQDKGTLKGFNKYLWDNWFNPELNLPKHLRLDTAEKCTEKAKTELLVLFNQRAATIAIRQDTTPKEIVLNYFRKLDYYTESKKDRPADDRELMNVREQLQELFAGIPVETLTIVGRPYFFERGWWGGWRVHSAEEMEQEIVNGSTHLTYDHIHFLEKAGFKRCWEL